MCKTLKSLNNYFKENLTGKPIFLIPVSIILTIVPLIVHLKVVTLDEDTTKLYGNSLQTDLFSQEKASYLLYFSVLLFIIGIIFFKTIFQKKDKIVNLILMLVGIFWLFILLSAVFSEHKFYAFWGAYDRAEGLITLTCYMILLVYSIYTFRDTNNYEYIAMPILILIVVLSILGAFQYTGHDLINSKIGSFLVTGKSGSKFALSFAKGKLYGTLYHYDYVGSFVAIVLPILVTLSIFEKKIVDKIILSIGSLLSLWLLFGSSSRAGLVGVAFSFIFAVILFGKSMIKKWKPILAGFFSIIILIIGLNALTKGSIFERIPSLLSDASIIFTDTSNLNYSDSTPIKDIKYVNGHSEVYLKDEVIKIYYENNNFIFKNSNDQNINYTENARVFTTNDSNFKNISFTFSKTSGSRAGFLYLTLNGKNIFSFGLGQDGTIHLVNPSNNQNIDVAHPEVTQFLIGKEKLGSSRGYIWSRSIPLIKDHLILGSGPDTFPFDFPQNDYIGKYYAYDTPNMFVDKPHNLYLQIALNYGLIALIAFLSIIFIYIFDCIKLYAFKDHYNYPQVLGIANALGIIGYLFAGFFNDSVISVAPIFWIILGVGISINFINRKSLTNN